MFLGVLNANGGGFLIVYSCPNLPRPVNNEGYCEIMLLNLQFDSLLLLVPLLC